MDGGLGTLKEHSQNDDVAWRVLGRGRVSYCNLHKKTRPRPKTRQKTSLRELAFIVMEDVSLGFGQLRKLHFTKCLPSSSYEQLLVMEIFFWSSYWS